VNQRHALVAERADDIDDRDSALDDDVAGRVFDGRNDAVALPVGEPVWRMLDTPWFGLRQGIARDDGCPQQDRRDEDRARAIG